MPDKQIINVWISGEAEYPVFLHEQELVRINPGGGSDVDRELFLLTDASGWIRESKEPTAFASGDRIVIGASLNENKFLLINIDKNVPVNLGGGKIGIRLAQEIVDPFHFKKVVKK